MNVFYFLSSKEKKKKIYQIEIRGWEEKSCAWVIHRVFLSQQLSRRKKPRVGEWKKIEDPRAANI